MKHDLVYVGHIVDALSKIETYTQGVSYEQFMSNEMMIDAVLREMQIIGEAAKRLSQEFKDKHPDIPWRANTVYLQFASQEEAEQAIRNFWQQRDPTVVENIDSGRLFVNNMITAGSRTDFGPIDPSWKAKGYSIGVQISDNGLPLRPHTIEAIRNLGYEIEDF